MLVFYKKCVFVIISDRIVWGGRKFMMLVKIVYVSMIGNIEEIVDIVVEVFEDLELEVEIDECM